MSFSARPDLGVVGTDVEIMEASAESVQKTLHRIRIGHAAAHRIRL